MNSTEVKKMHQLFALTPFFKWSMFAMVLSYFYNLSIVGYSLKGDNEFRIYDFVGLFLLFTYFKYKEIVNAYIKAIPFFKHLYVFLMWCNFSIFFTLLFSVFENRILWFVQSVLYLYHFWVFFLTAVFLSIYIQDLKKLKWIVQSLMIIASVAFLIVILQNLGMVPFLWSNAYFESYHGFLSGTMGPNKVVVGVSTLMMLILCIGLVNEKRVKLNFALINVTMVISIITLLMSGSRTAYLGLLAFGLFYFVRNTFKFFIASLLIGIMFFSIASVKPEIFEKINQTFENRVEKKIRRPTAIKEGRVDELYEDLGAGRKGLSMQYVTYLFENPYIIPFGVGFNNRLLIGFSAHNIYLSLINEVGLVGLFLYLRWLLSFLWIRMRQFSQLEIALKGLVFAMIVTLFFGEHLYVYRPLFGLVGLFLVVTVLLFSPIFYYIAQTDESN